MTKMPATVMTAGLLKPENACSTEMRPVRARERVTMTAIKSARSFSVANSASAPTVMTARVSICTAADSFLCLGAQSQQNMANPVDVCYRSRRKLEVFGL